MTSATSVIVRNNFERLVDADDNTVPLARVALTIAQEEYPDLDRRVYEQKLDTIARAIRAHRGSTDDGLKCLAAIDEQLFTVEGFRGNTDGYYDPRNSFLNDVIDRKLGIPITLSIIYLELCWRVGISAVGVGLPGHFIVLVDIGELLYIDPFDRGARLNATACEELFRRVHGNAAVFHRSMLAPVPRRQILFRMLANLKHIYLRGKEFGRALAAIDRMIVLYPNAAAEYRDRAWICHQIGFTAQACADYQTYLRLNPDAPDVAVIRETVATVLAQRGSNN